MSSIMTIPGEEMRSQILGKADAHMVDLTVIILTHNETRHISRAIASVSTFAKRVVVVDSFSTDDTVALATQAGAEVLQNKWVNYSHQFGWALDNAGIETAWVMRLDADEVIEPDLARNIASSLPTMAADVAGINLSRKHIFMDQWVRRGGRYPLWLLRIWRTGQGRIEVRWMDEHIVVWGGRTLNLEGGFSDWNLNGLSFFTAKHNSYATREAVDVIIRRQGLFPNDDAVTDRGGNLQALIKRTFKEGLYNRMPFWAAPFLYFLYRYIAQLGILDGKAGLVYHFLQGCWYRFLVEAKVIELEASMDKGLDTLGKLQDLSALTGLALLDDPRWRSQGAKTSVSEIE